MIAPVDGSAAGPEPDAAARRVFGEQLELAERYVALLADAGVERGLIGPAERERLWSRHLVNSAIVAELLPDRARVVDVGSGAGLPGVPLAICRSDLRVDLVEPMQRRVDFLVAAVEELGLTARVRVVRGRADARDVVAVVGDSEWVTARAVAPLGRLASWCLPLLRQGGRLLALKGERAEVEVRNDEHDIRRAGGIIDDVVVCGLGAIPDPVKVVVVRRA